MYVAAAVSEVMTEGSVVTGSGWEVTTVGWPVITPSEFVSVVKDVKPLVYRKV